MSTVVAHEGEAGLAAGPAIPVVPAAQGAVPTDEVGLARVSAAMRELQSAIDGLVDSRTCAVTANPPVVMPVAVREPTEVAASLYGDAWGQAVAVRAVDDPQRSWIEANAAMRRGEHGKAFELFQAEADRAAEAGDHARAAIAYRMASDAATALGRRDSADHALRRAGKHYLFVAESPTSSLQTMFRSYLTASRCFLTVGNLELTQSCVGRALALQQTMNEDLHIRFNGPARDPG